MDDEGFRFEMNVDGEIVANDKKATEMVFDEIIFETQTPTVEIPEPEKDVWEKGGFQSTYRNLIGHFENLSSNDTLDKQTRDLLRLISSATNVEQFVEYSHEQLERFISQIFNTLPRLERNLRQFQDDIRVTRAVAVDTDFI